MIHVRYIFVEKGRNYFIFTLLGLFTIIIHGKQNLLLVVVYDKKSKNMWTWFISINVAIYKNRPNRAFC